MTQRLLSWCLIACLILIVVFLELAVAKSFGHSSICPKNNVAVQRSPGATPKCRPCPVCPEGMGLSIKCDGQIVDSSEIECQHCTPGVNYSPENDYSQCIPCNKCEGQEIIGNCTEKMDNRKCVPCGRAWFFDKESGKCLHCSNCQNMTREARGKCITDGFNIDTYCMGNTLSTQATTTAAQKEAGQIHLSVEVVIIVGIVFGVVVICSIYGCLVVARFKKFKNLTQRSPKGREWCSLFLCCPYNSRNTNSGPSILTGNEEVELEVLPSVPSNTEGPPTAPPTQDDFHHSANRRTTEYRLIRNEESVNESPDQNTNIETECLKERLKVVELNAEACRKMYSLLNVKNDLGIGYTTLGGLMGYSAQKVNEFELTDNPSKSLVEYWNQTKSNTALKLIKHLKSMGRDDIVDILQNDLDKVACHCAKCERV